MKKFWWFFAFCGLVGLGFLIWGVIQGQEYLKYLYQEVRGKGKAVIVARPSTEFEFESGGLTLRGSLYLPRGKGPFPGIVFTHGGTSLGRKLPLYQVLGRQLSRRGYAVLTFDFRGYGESDDPERFEADTDFDFIGDVKQALAYLMTVERVDPSHVYLAGHSFGAGVIIPAGAQDDRVRGIISIAPGRRGDELMWAPDAPLKHYPRQRIAVDMQIPELRRISTDFINPILQYVTIDTILTFPQHPPLLVIDGALEPPEDLAFLKNFFQRITPPKTHVTIENAGHYFGVKQDEPLEARYYIVTYWPDIIDALVDTIDRWIAANLSE